MEAAVTGSVQLQSHVFRNPSDFRDVAATPFARRSTHRIEHKDRAAARRWVRWEYRSAIPLAWQEER